MNADVKALWVAALRSGDYTQAKRYLRTDDGHCCLGVLCEVAVAAGVYVPADWRGFTLLPDEVRGWAGLRTDSGENVTIGTHRDYLPEHNDIHGATFAQIADAIEAQL